jgi:hypothetical protein
VPGAPRHISWQEHLAGPKQRPFIDHRPLIRGPPMSGRSTDPPGGGRRHGDAALYELLRDVEFADHAFELLAAHLTAYGWGCSAGGCAQE